MSWGIITGMLGDRISLATPRDTSYVQCAVCKRWVPALLPHNCTGAPPSP